MLRLVTRDSDLPAFHHDLVHCSGKVLKIINGRLPMVFVKGHINYSYCVTVSANWTTTCWVPVTGVKQYLIDWENLSLQSQNATRFQVTLFVSGSDLGLELTTRAWRQISPWACFSTDFSLPWPVSIPVESPSSNLQHKLKSTKSCGTCAWTKQDFSSSLKGCNLFVTVSSYKMGKEGQNIWKVGMCYIT